MTAPSMTPPTIQLRQTYRKRTVRFLELFERDGWIVKLYGLSHSGAMPKGEVLEAARAKALEALPQPARTDERYGIAVVIAHEGQDHRWLLVDWWGHEAIFHQREFMASKEGLPSYEPIPGDVNVCVWELPILSFERDAWVEHVMSHPNSPKVADYLAKQVNGEF